MRCPECKTYLAELEDIYWQIYNQYSMAFESQSPDVYMLINVLNVLNKDNLVFKGKYPIELLERLGRQDLM